MKSGHKQLIHKTKTKRQKECQLGFDENLDAYDNIQNDARKRQTDPQYESLLPKNKNIRNSNSYFLTSNKYHGHVQSKSNPSVQMSNEEKGEEEQQQYDQEISEEQHGGQSSHSQQDQLHHAFRQLTVQRKNNRKLLYQKIQQIDQTDTKNRAHIQTHSDNLGNPQHLLNQLNQFNKLAEIRVYSQKNIENFKKFPTRHFPADPQLASLAKSAETSSLMELQGLISNFQGLTNKVYQQVQLANLYGIQTDQLQTRKQFSDIVSDVIQDIQKVDCPAKCLDVEKLWSDFLNDTKGLSKKLQEGIISWSQKTSLLRTSGSKYNSLFLQTPIGQAEKAIKDWQRVNRKCQLKRAPFRILFEDEENYSLNHDTNIYDDQDLLQEVQRKYEENIQNLEPSDFIAGNTLQFIENRNKSCVKKQVDRKASKNRKIRYKVHPKLLSFMPCQVENLLEAREEIVSKLFSHQQQVKQPQNQESEGSNSDYIDI